MARTRSNDWAGVALVRRVLGGGGVGRGTALGSWPTFQRSGVGRDGDALPLLVGLVDLLPVLYCCLYHSCNVGIVGDLLVFF